jgi:hypothetical protein
MRRPPSHAHLLAQAWVQTHYFYRVLRMPRCFIKQGLQVPGPGGGVVQACIRVQSGQAGQARSHATSHTARRQIEGTWAGDMGHQATTLKQCSLCTDSTAGFSGCELPVQELTTRHFHGIQPPLQTAPQDRRRCDRYQRTQFTPRRGATTQSTGQTWRDISRDISAALTLVSFVPVLGRMGSGFEHSPGRMGLHHCQ